MITWCARRRRCRSPRSREPFTPLLIYAYGEFDGDWDFVGESASGESTFYLTAINNSSLAVDVLAWRVVDGLGETRLDRELSDEAFDVGGRIAYGGGLAPVYERRLS